MGNFNCRQGGIIIVVAQLTRLPQMLANDAIMLTPANWLKARSGKEVHKAA